jgi:hypothetical protein
MFLTVNLRVVSSLHDSLLSLIYGTH